MSLITLLNTYVINDISSIIYDYYYDSYKIKELKKDLLIEYHKKIYSLHNITYYCIEYRMSISIHNCHKINNKIHKLYRYGSVAILPKNY